MSHINNYTTLSLFAGPDEAEIFIGCASFEERCQASLLDTSENYSPISVILMFSEEHIKKGQTKEFLNSMCQAANIFSGKNPKLIGFDLASPRQSVDDIRSTLEDFKRNYPMFRLTLDITTFPRQVLFLILREIRKLVPIQNLRLLYSEPKHYGTEKDGGWLTRGVKSVVTMSGFGGAQDPLFKKLLVIMTGHEGERSYIIWRRHQPEMTVFMPQGEPYHKGLNGIAEKENSLLKAILGDVCLYTRKLSARDVDGVYLELERIFVKYAHEYYFVVAPMGTKMQALGIYLFAESRPDVQITYAVPIHYNYNDYSSGVGHKWEIRNLDPYLKTEEE